MQLALGVFVIEFLENFLAAAVLTKRANLIRRIIGCDQIADYGERRITAREIGNSIEIAVKNTVGNRVNCFSVRDNGLGWQHLDREIAEGHFLEFRRILVGHEPVRPIT